MKPLSERSTICQIHQFDQQENDRQLQCHICVEKLKNETSQYQNVQSNKTKIQSIEQDINRRINILDKFLLKINQTQISVLETINKVAAHVQKQIQLLKRNFENFQGFQRFNQSQSDNGLQIEIQTLKQSFAIIRKSLIEQIAQTNIQQHFDHLIEHLENQWDLFQKKNRSYPVLQYQFKEEHRCDSLSFNHNDTILAIGQEDRIKIYKFTNGKLKGLNCLTTFESDVNCLQFFPNSENILVSGHKEGRLKIWKQTNNLNFCLHQELCEHTNQINCMDCSSNQLIVGDNSGHLKFWSLQNSTLILQQSVEFFMQISCLSINSQGSKVICCADANNIYIFLFDGQQWKEMQKIVVLKFINNLKLFENHFVVSSTKSHKLIVYQQSNDQYEKGQEINFKNKGWDIMGFPICSSKNGFICKYLNEINFYAYTTEEAVKLDHTIKFASQGIFGCISNNQDYLIVWDQQVEQLKIFKFEEKNDQ